MLSGFAKPMLGLVAALVAGFALPSRSWMIGWLLIVGSIFAIGGWHSRFAARRQTDHWCRTHGCSSPRWLPRGGFVSWGWSFWTFAEVLQCEFEDSNGAKHNVLVDLRAPAFGFWVRIRVLRNVNEEFTLDKLE